jgi:hypothetical protein
MTRWLTTVAVAGLLTLPSTSSAALLQWNAVLTGGQENPPTGAAGTGFGRVSFDDATNVLDVSLEWNGLTGNGVQAHIHCCTTPNLNTGIALDLWLVADPQPLTGVYAASYDLDLVNPFRATFMPGGTALSKFAAVAAAMDIQNAYFNIHTALNPGGEIRGNISPVPEPTSLLLLASGLALTRLRRRR